MGFNRALDQACGDFCNSNAACTVSTKSPELLASYCDLLLRKSNKDSDAESLEASLSKAVSFTLFDFCCSSSLMAVIVDDHFQFYRRQRCLPQVLSKKARSATCRFSFCLRRRREQHDHQTQGVIWFRIYQQIIQDVYR